MNTMTPSIWQQATGQYLQRAADKALRKGRLLKVRSPKDLGWYLDHGWAIVSHTPSSYGQGQYWLLRPTAR
jgi:hypothetical protein